MTFQMLELCFPSSTPAVSLTLYVVPAAEVQEALRAANLSAAGTCDPHLCQLWINAHLLLRLTGLYACSLTACSAFNATHPRWQAHDSSF